MRIAISTDSGKISPHFGRCENFTLVEIEEGEIKDKKTMPNPGHKKGYLPKLLREKEVDIIITGGIGKRAISLFNKLGIEVISGAEGRTERVIEKFLRGELKEKENPCQPGSGKEYKTE